MRVAIVLGLICVAQTAFAEGIDLRVEHEGPLVLGETEEVGVTLLAPETAEDVGRPLRVSVNVGSFGDVQRVKAGEYRTTYRLPETRFPQVALVAVWRETGEKARIDFARIPLSGRTELPVRSKPGSMISVLVGEQTYGPVKADRRGRAKLPIAVPPGVLEVVATSSRGADLSQGTVKVNVPKYNRMTLAVTPYLVPADGQSAATALVFYDVEAPPPIDKVRLKLEGEASVTPLGADGGRYRYRIVPKRGTKDKKLSLSAKVRRDRVSSAAATIEVGSPVPANIVPRGIRGKLVADGSSAGLRVLVTDKLGLGVPGLTLQANTNNGGKVLGITEERDGHYEVKLQAPDTYPAGGELSVSVKHGDLDFELRPPIEPPPWPTTVDVDVSPLHPIADGKTPFTIEMRPYDAAKRPMSNASLSIDGVPTSTIRADGTTFRAEATPARGLETLTFVVKDRTGHLSNETTLELRTPPPLMTVGGWVAAGYFERFVPTFGLEVGYRPPILDSNLVLFGSLSARRLSRTFDARNLPESSVRLDLLPLALGATYDFYAAPRLRAYGGAAALIAPFEYRVESDFQGRTITRDISAGGELVAGAEWHGVFLELSLSYLAISAPGLRRPSPAVFLGVGYRLGVL